MKFSVQRQELLSTINQVIGAVENRATVPALSHLLFAVYMRGAIGITATDLEIFAEAECKADVPEEGGEACVPAKKIKEALDAIPVDTVEFSLEDLTMVLEGDGIRYTFACLSAKEFPTVPEYPVEDSVEFVPGVLPKMINACVHAAADPASASFHLMGVNLRREDDRLIAVATDKYRISLVGLALQQVENLNKSLILPLKACKLISGNVSTIEFFTDDRKAYFLSAQGNITSALIDAEYLNFRAVIPKDHPYLTTIDRKRFIEALEACGVVSDDKGRTIRLEIAAKDQLTVSALGSLGTASAEIPCTGDYKLKIGLPSRQLLQALKALDGDEVFLKYNGDRDPLLIFPADHGSWDERFEMICALRV